MLSVQFGVHCLRANEDLLSLSETALLVGRERSALAPHPHSVFAGHLSGLRKLCESQKRPLLWAVTGTVQTTVKCAKKWHVSPFLP